MTSSVAALSPRVAIIGGGLAGMAAASALSGAGFSVVLFESRATLGGRAASYRDALSGDTIDNCQHVAMGCCTNFLELCRQLGIEQEFVAARELNFISGSGRVTQFRESALPAPGHLLLAFWKLPWLTTKEQLLFARAVLKLARTPATRLQGQNFADWLRGQHQTENLIRNAWELVLVSALSESLDRTDAAYARKVFVDGFLTHRAGWRVLIPRLTLKQLFAERGAQALSQRGVELRMRSTPQVKVTTAGLAELHVPQAGDEHFTDIVVAVPWHQLAETLPAHPLLDKLRSQASLLDSAPITSVNLWYDRPLTDLPHVVLVGRLSQWIFRRESSERGELHQVVISNSRNLHGIRAEELIQLVQNELQDVFPAAKTALLQHARVLTERRAVFAVTPGVDENRPTQLTEIPNLQIAGDWTHTGWPSTMEGAVKSGFLAADNILRQHGRPGNCTQSGLPASWVARWLLGRNLVAKDGI